MSRAQVDSPAEEHASRQPSPLTPSLAQHLAEKSADSKREARAKRWLEDNRQAIEAYNKRIQRDGPLNQALTRS